MSPTAERPIALIVEDRPDTLATRRELFTTYGFQAIGAKTVEEAMREFRATPTIDVVVTDINLDVNDRSDRSGVNLARTLRKKRPQLPIIAYSAHFDVLDASDKAEFSDSLLKGELALIGVEGKLDDWKTEALRYRERRAETAKSELNRMRSEGRLVDPPDVNILRDFLPGTSNVAPEDPDNFLTPDDMLRREGWRFRLIEAGFKLAETSVRTAVAVPFWIRRESDRSIAVLQGHSCIYSDDSNEDAAVGGALELMFGYFQELNTDAKSPLSPELNELMRYLQKVFE